MGNYFLIDWQDQVRLGILHEDWHNIPHAAHTVRTNEEDEELPEDWPQEMQDTLNDYADIFEDKLTPDRRLQGEPMHINMHIFSLHQSQQWVLQKIYLLGQGSNG